MAACEGPRDLRDQLEVFRDERGTLTLADLESLPFVPVRAYVLHGIPVGARRAGHAHRRQRRWLAVISGSVEAAEDDGRGSRIFELGGASSRSVPPGVGHGWGALAADL